MFEINDKQCVAHFGNINDNISLNGSYSTEKLINLSKKLEVDHLIFLKQTHSKTVMPILQKPTKLMTAFETEGDAIITNQKNIGIGVVTADCVPVFLYDPLHHAIAVIHAGWRGLSKRIISETLCSMRDTFDTNAAHLKAYIGPCASVCCYEVQSDFLTDFPDGIFEKRDDKIFFDSLQFAICELKDNGLSAINTDHHRCTICQPGFCSVRKNKENAGRQPSVIYLK